MKSRAGRRFARFIGIFFVLASASASGQTVSTGGTPTVGGTAVEGAPGLDLTYSAAPSAGIVGNPSTSTAGAAASAGATTSASTTVVPQLTVDFACVVQACQAGGAAAVAPTSSSRGMGASGASQSASAFVNNPLDSPNAFR